MCDKDNCNCGSNPCCGDCEPWNCIEQAVNDVWATKEDQIEELVDRAETAATNSEASAKASADSAAEAKEFRDEAEQAATTAVAAEGIVVGVANDLQDTADKLKQIADELGTAIAGISVVTWYYTAVSDNQTVIPVPTDKNQVDVQAIFIEGARQEPNRGFTYDALNREITLAEGIPLGLEISIIIGTYSDNPNDFANTLASNNGATLVGTSEGKSVQVVLNEHKTAITSLQSAVSDVTDRMGTIVPYTFESVTSMLASSALKTGHMCYTVTNEYGHLTNALWKISASADSTTYSRQLASGLYANLRPRNVEEYASFGFGSTTDANLNLAATTEAHRVATAKSHMSALVFPAGVFPILTTNLLVPRRYFQFLGKGWDITTLKYVGTDLGDSVCLVLDNPDAALTRNHFYQTVADFTVDGGMEGGHPASSVAINGHYPYVRIKSIGHFYSDIDANGLVGQMNCHTQGRAHATNSAWWTRCGVSFNYNAWDAKGYLSNGNAAYKCINIDGGETKLTVAATAGSTTLTVADASKFRRHFILDIEPEGGDGVAEAIAIQSVAGNVITLKLPLARNHAVNANIINSVYGININGATMEVGKVTIGNSNNVNITGCYMEGARPEISNFPRKLNISDNIISEVDALISEVNRLSEIRYRNNLQPFPLRVNVRARDGSLNPQFFDLYNMPLLDAGGITRKQGAISINETDAASKNGIYLQDVVVRDVYDTNIGGTVMREMEFDGLFATAPATGNVTALSLYNGIPSGGNFNGYTFDISARMHREANIIPGLAHVIATAYNQNGTTGAENKTVASLFGALWNDTTGVRILAGATASRASLTCFGEASGTQKTSFALSGKIACAV